MNGARGFAAALLVALLGVRAAESGAKPSSHGVAPAGLTMVVNGSTLPSYPPPLIVGGRVVVPAVPILNALAISVARRGKALVATAPSDVLTMTVGSAQASINDRRVKMEAPAFELHGTTYVPLRFITDALGALMSYDRRSGRIAIVSSLVGRAQTMSVAGPAGETTITGVVSAIDQNSAPPTLTVVRGGNVRTIAVDPRAKTTIQDVTTRTTLDGTFAAIHVGDSVSVRLAKNGDVVELLDLYASRSGTLVAVSGTSIVLSSGQVVTPTRATTITLNDDPAQLTDLASGDSVIVRSNPETGEAREIIAARAAATAPTPAPGATAPSVAISSFAIDATHALRAGEAFDVTLVGTPGGRATYDVGTFLTGLPMRETQPGTYTARYVVSGSINFAAVPVFGSLSVGTQMAAKAQAKALLSVATLPPQITEVAPSPSQSVNDPRPSIYATFDAPSGVGVDPNSASINVNGRDVTAAATRSASFITYVSPGNVGDGPINVTVRVADLAGNVASRSWSFSVRSH